MTDVESTEDVAETHLDHVHGATGHVMLVEGEDETGDRAIAVWRTSATGIPVGAWIKPVALLAADPAAAEELLGLTSHRALFGWDSETGSRLLNDLAGWAQTKPVVEPATVLLPDLLVEIGEHRAAYEAVVEEHQSQSRSKLSPLKWRCDIPAADSWLAFVEAAGLHQPAGASPVAAEALHLVRAVAWAAELWDLTEAVRVRRKYLVDRFGAPAVLPPRWLGLLRHAHAVGKRV